ncbi:hypothetical protein Egran_02819 [Elaphomyces granulatus]|uniref:DUF155 domain-containing protein n=1 Tax=Elaphomyces granulatus TaxID=519963 RepID=A0A232M005_9EURO|nr:hypothetical protein Egran_02819 [Elaphomyces granulatus]
MFATIRQPRNQHLHASSSFSHGRRKDFFSSNAVLRQSQSQSQPANNTSKELNLQGQSKKRKAGRSAAANTSLRRVAVEAQRSRDGILSDSQLTEKGLYQTKVPQLEPFLSPPCPPPYSFLSFSSSHFTTQVTNSRAKTVTAYAVAEQFNIEKARAILQEKGYEPDPFHTGLYPQVIHIEVPLDSLRRLSSPNTTHLSADEVGDVFVFPSGTVVTWSLPEEFTSYLATKTLLPAAEGSQITPIETENLDFLEDSQRENSSIKGDTVILGTKSVTEPPNSTILTRQSVDTVLTKIAFSSGLARSTKLAVLESLLSNYFESTRPIPKLLSQGSRLPFTREFILRKTGQLLSVRAQLNLYSELTDSLPDIFWDSRHDLGLEGYYEQVGRALDVGIRIKLLNEKMDYAQEIASVLRERLSEKHGLRLEWTIILLIAVEVGFEILRLWKEKDHESKAQIVHKETNNRDQS